MKASNAALYGKGIFTTIAIYDGEPFLWEKHWLRLTSNGAKIGIDLSDHSEQTTHTSLIEVIEKNGVTGGRARITFSDESESPIWGSETGSNTGLQIITDDLRPISDNVKITVSPYPVNSRSPLAGVKSCNYLENLLAIENAKKGGFNEAIRLNERGEITSACMANVFWLKDERLYTPSLSTGCLAGTTREFVMENLNCSEVESGFEELEKADGIFLTSAGLGVIQAAQFGSRAFETIAHPILNILPKHA